MDNIIVALILGVAVFYVYRRIVSGFKKKDPSGCASCDSCPNKKNTCDTDHQDL